MAPLAAARCAAASCAPGQDGGNAASTPRNSQGDGVPNAVLSQVQNVATLSVADGNDKALRMGTGFPLSPTAIVTNWHVVKGAASVVALFADGVPVKLDAVLGADERNDLIILGSLHGGAQLRPGLSAFSLAASLPKVGSRVFVVGSPQGLGGTVSEGLVSALRQDQDVGGSRIQISAALSPGSSGSPVMNPDGVVVGVASSTLESSQLINFAIPSTLISSIPLAAPRSLRDFTWSGAPAPSDAEAVAQVRALKSALYERVLSYCVRDKALPPEVASIAAVFLYGRGAPESTDTAKVARDFKTEVLRKAKTLLAADTPPCLQLVEKRGWYEVESNIELDLFFLYGLGPSAEEAKDLCARSKQLVCEYPSCVDAWMLLDWLNRWILHDGTLADRPVFEVARLRREDPLARLWYHDFVGGTKPAQFVLGHGPQCDDHSKLQVYVEPFGGSELARDFVSVVNPDESLRVISRLATQDSRWNMVPKYLFAQGVLMRDSIERDALAAAHPEDPGLLARVAVEGDLSREYPFRWDVWDVEPGLIEKVRSHGNELRTALAWCEQSIQLESDAAKAEILRHVDPYAKPYAPDAGECFQCRDLAYYLGDIAKAVSYGKKACEALERAPNFSPMPEKDQPDWLSRKLYDKQGVILGYLTYARLCKACGDASAATPAIQRARELRTQCESDVSEADRMSPVFRNWSKGQDEWFSLSENARVRQIR